MYSLLIRVVIMISKIFMVRKVAVKNSLQNINLLLNYVSSKGGVDDLVTGMN
jgi:hypothetical protein